MSRKFGAIFHAGYLVPDLQKAIDYWVNSMGVGPFYYEEYILPTGFTYLGKPIRVHSKVALAYSGETYVELIEDLSPDECPNTLFMKEMPGGRMHVAGGLQHVGCLVDSVEEMLKDPEVAKITMMTAQVGPIRLAYLQPSEGAIPGTMIELIERGPMILAKIAAIKAASIDWDGSDPVRTLKKG